MVRFRILEVALELEFIMCWKRLYMVCLLYTSRMRMHASRRGYNLTHRSRPVCTEDFYHFDMIIGMDDRNIAVSYTHLDVYKRQLLCLSGIEGKGISCLFATLSKESEPFAIPVG